MNITYLSIRAMLVTEYHECSPKGWNDLLKILPLFLTGPADGRCDWSVIFSASLRMYTNRSAVAYRHDVKCTDRGTAVLQLVFRYESR